MHVPASQSLMSPSLGVQLLVTHPLKKKLLVCVCVCASLCTYTHKYIVAADFLLVLAGTKTISYWHSQKKKKNQCLSVYNTPNFFRYFYTTAAYMYATWTTALHHSKPQLSVSVSYQKPNFPDTPCSPFVSGIVTLPRFESLSLGDE